ncbi:MAG: SDR family oxidoreductase [Nitratireductor sp.]|nr:SDR family oxidoreductase [Nitratireductor sp.]
MATILITGCSSGIGKHCALRLREEGWNVVATARKPADIEMLNDAGLTGVYLDYTESSSLAAAVEVALEAGDGRIDALFNNGAYGQAGAVEDVSTDVLRRQFEANFFGWHELTNLVVPHMRKAGAGRIVHCSSILGIVPYRWRGAYNASKFALEGLASTMRLELRGSGIHVSLIEPGPIVSKFTTNGLQHFVDNIDVDNSVHHKVYRKQLERLQSEGGVNRFRLPPEAVYVKLRHALTSHRPRAHYHVTVPTKFMGVAKRLLPQPLIDRLLLKSG